MKGDLRNNVSTTYVFAHVCATGAHLLTFSERLSGLRQVAVVYSPGTQAHDVMLCQLDHLHMLLVVKLVTVLRKQLVWKEIGSEQIPKSMIVAL